MMRDQGQPSAGHRYMSQPVDPSSIGQQKINQLHRQLEGLEDDMQQRQRLISRLSRIQDLENEKKERQDRIIERNSPVTHLLQDEMERLYGRDSVNAMDSKKTPVDRNIIDTVIQHRTKEFSAKQQEAVLQAKYLDKERQRLQEARVRVQEQRRLLMGSLTPSERARSDPGTARHDGLTGPDRQHSLPSRREVMGVDSFIQKTVDEMPSTLNKVLRLREDLEKHYLYYRRPYNGELGIESYEQWQLPHYALCREIVNEVVEDFMNLYFKHDNVVEKGTYKAMLEEEEKWMSRQSESLSEKRAVLLISEELFLDETSAMVTDVIREMYHLYGTFRNFTDGMIIETAEMVSTEQDHARDPIDKMYNMVSKTYFTTKENRNRHRKAVWGHSQHAQNKYRKRQIIRKKEGYVDEEDEVDEEETPRFQTPQPDDEIPSEWAEVVSESDGDELDAPDMTILDFNNLSTTQLRKLEASPLDSPDVKLDKEFFRRYARRELDYWSKIFASVHHVNIAKRCRGIRIVRPSPNHRFVAVATYNGDIFILDVLMQPWRPFKALCSTARSDEYALNVSWSLDSSRLIVVNTAGQLQVLSIYGGSAESTDAKKIGLNPDDKGIYAHKLQVLLELDVDNEDFVFQQGILAEENAQDDPGLVPVRASFFPSLTFLGVQNDMVVALNNGDMFKCNFQNTLYGIEYTDSDTPKQTATQNQNKAINNSKQTGTQDQKKATGSAKQAGSSSNKDGNGVDEKESDNKETNGDREKSKEETNEDEEEEEDEPDLDNNKIYKPMLVPGGDAADINTIGQDVEAELLRGHKYSILHISFVESLNAMVTVDTKGNLYVWKYDLKFKASFGWFVPARKYKVETNKLMFQELGTDNPKVNFTDKTAPGKKRRTRQEIAAQRRRVQNTLDNMQLTDPWHEEYLPDEDMNVKVFAPRGNIPETGAMFHIVYTHPDTGQLSTYLTRLYGPVKIKCTRILRVMGSPTGTQLVFILLFNKYPPKGAHFTIFVVDLTVMELRDFRKDIPLTDEEYAQSLKKSTVSCDISRVFGPTGSDYLFITVNGKLHGLSLTTGQDVFRVEAVRGPVANPDGCSLDIKQLKLPPDAECTCLGFEGKLYCICFARKVNRLYIVDLDDRNQYDARRAMWKSYSVLPDHKVVPTELRVNSFDWDLEDILHPSVAMRKIILKKMDTDMRKTGLIRDHPRTILKQALTDKVEDYKALEKAVTHSGLLEKKGVWGGRDQNSLSDDDLSAADDEEKF